MKIVKSQSSIFDQVVHIRERPNFRLSLSFVQRTKQNLRLRAPALTLISKWHEAK